MVTESDLLINLNQEFQKFRYFVLHIVLRYVKTNLDGPKEPYGQMLVSQKNFLFSQKFITRVYHFMYPYIAQNLTFSLRISSVNVTKSAVSWRSGHIYWRNPSWKTRFLSSVTLS